MMRRVDRPRATPPASEATAPPSTRPLISRATLHRTRPFFKAVLSIMGWANSAVTTVLCALWVEQQVTGRTSWIGWVAGFTVALVLTVGQIYTAGVSFGGYVACLLPDVLMTAAQHQRWLVVIMRVFFGRTVGAILGWIGALIIGYYSARLPERLTFGDRT